MVAKQCAYYPSRSHALVLAAESLDERGQNEFNAWIDGTQHSLPDEMFKKNINICSEHATRSWEVEARRLAKIHGSIADATFKAMLKQVRQQRGEQLQRDYQKLQN